ncbi:DnaB-like helicase C terminal domain-containing protein [Lachnospiraceae bacterium XBB2008]|nr:DnaB-like helicase C terminal domain-containing protein [Lachnospiraceae bacterium XBB2008]
MRDYNETFNTGLKELDDLTGGFQNGQLILVGGRPAMGKSSLAYSIMLNSLDDPDRNCALFSLDSPANLVIKRLAELKEEQDIQDGSSPSLSQAFMDISLSSLFIDSDSNDIDEIIKRGMRIKHSGTLIIVDYLQLISAGNIRDEKEKNSEVLIRLKQLADEMCCPVLVLSQLSRDIENRRNHRPELKDFADIPCEAFSYIDQIMFLYRESYYNDETEFPDETEIEVVKHSKNKTGVVLTGFNGRTGFYDLEEDMEDE